MLNFLNSAVLVAAAAALIPLIIHLFSRRKVKIIEFSSLKHLKEMQKRQVRRLKIRQLLLLILRMLIILVAVLAFARPASKGGYIGSHAGVSAVVLLDKSASMQRQVKDGQLFALAKEAAGDILENFGESDEVILIPFDKECYFPSGERFFNRDVAENILESTVPGFIEGNLEIAYNKAVELLNEAQNLNRELYLITDRQLSSLPEEVDTSAENITTYTVDLPVEIDGNNGVVTVDLGGQLIEVGSPFSVRAEIKNYDNFDKSEILASLFVDETRVMQSELTLDALGKTATTFGHTVYRPGFHSGWVELSDDDYLPDNRFYFTFRIPENFNILIVDEDNSGNLIRLALMPSDKLARYWSIKTITAGQLAEVKLRDYDAVVVAGLSSLREAETSRLLRYVDNGGGLFLIFGGNIDADYFNQNLSGIMDLTVDKGLPAFFSGAGYYTMERFDYGHPIFTAFENFAADSLPAFRFFALPETRDGSGNRDLAFFSNRTAAVVEAMHGLGRIICLTAPIDPKYSDLATHSFFVPFLIRTMEYLSGHVAEYEISNRVGQAAARSLTGQQVQYGSVQMITPDNREFKIAGVEKTGQISFNCRPIDYPGIYRLIYDDRTVDLFPANLNAVESDLNTVEISRLGEVLGLDEIKTIPYRVKAASVITTSRFGRELWQLFLWAVVILVAVEMFLARSGRPESED